MELEFRVEGEGQSMCIHRIEIPASGEGCKILYYNKVVLSASAHEAHPSETFYGTERPAVKGSRISL